MANHLVPIILVSRWELCNWVIAFSDGGHSLCYSGVSICNYSGLYYPPFCKKIYLYYTWSLLFSSLFYIYLEIFKMWASFLSRFSILFCFDSFLPFGLGPFEKPFTCWTFYVTLHVVSIFITLKAHQGNGDVPYLILISLTGVKQISCILN